MDIGNRSNKAKDLNFYNIQSLNAMGVGDIAQEANQAQLRNEAAEQVSKQLETPDYNKAQEQTSAQSDESGIFSFFADPWRQANVQGHQVNLDKKLFELNESEAKWMPELQQAKQYIETKQELQKIEQELQQPTQEMSPDQLQELQNKYQELSLRALQLEVDTKSLAKTNPYLQNVFYDTGKNGISGSQAIAHPLTKEQGDNIGALGLDEMWQSKNYKGGLNTQYKELLQNISVADAKLKTKAEDIQAKINTIKKGNLLFDPSKIDAEFKEKFESNEIEAADPSTWYYALPHLGSSYSEFGAMLGQMTASTLLNGVAKAAIGASSGGTLPLLFAITEAGVNLGIASYMRDSETSSEAFSAYQERVLNEADKGNISIQSIIDQTDAKLKEYGYDTDEMSDHERFQLSVAHNINTDSEVYNGILGSAKSGLQTLIATNNALSVPDYLQSTMFSYGGRYLADAFGKFSKAGKLIPNAGGEALKKAGNGIIDRTITKVADKIAKTPMGKVAAKSRIEGLTDIGKALGMSYFTERTEEGVQNIVSTRYKQGQYDNADSYSILDGLANAGQLGVEANLAYYGLHPDNTLNTDKDLQKEMNIGGFTGLFMSSVYGSANAYENVKQVITDQKLRGLVSDHYADAEKDNKVDQFINAAGAKGSNYGRIRNSLESLKSFKPEGVTDEMIDEDIALANTVSGYTSNKELTSIAKELGSKYGSTQYNQIIKNAVNIKDRLTQQSTASEEATKAYNGIENKIRKDKTLTSTLDSWYTNYLEERENKDEDPVPYEFYVDDLINKMVRLVDYNTLVDLDQQLSSRKQDLQQLKKDLDLDVNVDGISGIQAYVGKQLEDRKAYIKDLVAAARSKGINEEFSDQEIIDYINKENQALPFQEELQSALMSKYVNDGVRADLMLHNLAYITGKYSGDMNLYKPTWANITDKQRNSILTESAETSRTNGTAPKDKNQIIKEYDDQVNRLWDVNEDSADKDGLARKKAMSVIQRDLMSRGTKEEQAQVEKLEEHGTPLEDPVPPTADPLPIVEDKPVEEPAKPAQDSMEDTSVLSQDSMEEEAKPSEIERLLDKLDALNEDKLEQGDRNIDEEESAEFGSEEGVKLQEELENNKVVDQDEKTAIELLENTVVEVTSVDDTENGAQEAVKEEEAASFQEEKEEDEQGSSEVKQEGKVDVPSTPVTPPEPSPTVIPGIPEEGEKVISPTFDDGNPSELFVDPASNNLMWDPTGTQDMDNAIALDPVQLAMQQLFDEEYDPSITGPSDYSNSKADVDINNPIVTKSKQKKRHIANTFFYLPTANTVMPITVAGKPLQFKGKNGNEVERRPGSELASKLATPGWLGSIDDAYYVVTSSTHQMSGESAVKSLAVHIIIEKDGKVYNTSLRAISDGLRDDLINLGVDPTEVDAQIANLIALRTKIIKAYAPNYFADGKLPLEAPHHVKPTNLRISNGTLDNQSNDAGLPVYRGLQEVIDFKSIPQDSQELSKAIETGDVEIGYGTGPFGLTPFEIVKLDQTEQTSKQGTGYAGKLYYIPKVEDTPSKTATLPIMLAEELHKIPYATQASEVKLAKNVDGTPNIGEDGKPIQMSTAEIVYELLVNGIFYGELDQFLLNILANTGKKTLMAGLDETESNVYNFLIRKQLAIVTAINGKQLIVNGSLRDTSRPHLGYTTKFTNVKGITNAQKRKIVHEISENIHWNTDKQFLMSTIPQKAIDTMLQVIARQPQLAPTDTTPIKFVTDAITFTLKELGYTLKDGKPVKVGEPITMAAWFISHKKLKTDLGDHAFYAPFVYADEIKIDDNSKKEATSTVSQVTSTGKTITEKAPKKPTPVAEAKKATAKNPNIAEAATPENLAKYYLALPANQKLLPGYGWAIVVKEDGTRGVIQGPKKFIAGVFSKVQGTGLVNAQNAKEWLVQTLGIDPSNVLVTNAALSTVQDGKIYGVMRVAVNKITGELTPQIVISKTAGEGIEYHEAFHYVSLLLLNDKQRQRVYQDYVDSNADAKNLSIYEVEEMLAEEFRRYMLDKNNKSIPYRAIKFFKDIVEYVKAFFGKPNLKRELFKSIDSGEFANYRVSDKVRDEFYAKHEEGLFYYIPGLSKEDLSKMPNILDSNVFYKIVDSLVSTALATYNIRSAEDVANLDINSIFGIMQEQLNQGWISEENIELVKDVITNKDIFRGYILRKLNQLGIREADKLENQEDERLNTENGDNPDNVWDRNQSEFSKKVNISFRAKLFFYSVPKYEYVFNRDESTGVVTKEIVPVLDDIFGFSVTEPFNVVWNKLMENLWDIDTYEDLVNESARLAETDPLFHAVHELLTSEENPLSENTKTQLEVTIKSAKIQMNTIEATPDKAKVTNLSDAEAELEIAAALKRSIWEVNDSDTLRKIQKLPPRWSSAFFSSGGVSTNEDGSRYIDKAMATYISTRRTKINKLVEKVFKEKRKLKDGELLLQQMKDNFIEICNAIQIPFDNLSLNYLLENDSFSNLQYSNLTNIDQLNRFATFWNSKQNSFNAGVLGNIMTLSRTGKSSVVNRSEGKKARTIDRIFNYRDPNAQINMMAIAYGKMHPSPQEFSMIGADGALVYPISENNYMTDQIRNINKNANGKKQQILDTPYSKRSLIANAKDVQFKLHNFLALNMQDKGRDYFGISPVEDYIAKLTLTFNNQMVLPTMSDKKTWYSISGLTLIKDTLSSKKVDEAGVNYYSALGQNLPEDFQPFIDVNRSFSKPTLDIFTNYWLDEFDAVFDYYTHKAYVEQNPTLRADNYHGKINNGKMDASGNGGRFRYFSSLRVAGEVTDVNEDLADLETNGTNEEVMKYLQNLKVLMFGKSQVNAIEEVKPNAPIFEAMNNLLVGATTRELNQLVKRGIVGFENNRFYNKLIPYNIRKEYEGKMNSKMYSSQEASQLNEDILYSIIGSHVANSALSIIEVEKCFSGDPAYYKWQKSNKDIHDTDGTVIKSYDIITGRDVDKIKRLSAVLSTGTNLRTVWENAGENDTTVTVMHLKDNKVGSEYYSELKGIFRNSILRDLLSEDHPEYADDQLIQALDTEVKENNYYKTLSKKRKTFVDDYSASSANPYADGKINQSDAAVYVRPALYRRIMKALGEWSDQIEEAYNIMEGEDESWMGDRKLYANVTSALIKPLKMVYFGDHRDQSLNLNIPVFDKMAIFPMFKMLAKADNELIYNRMNNEELGVIDMITFESAVKVGGRQKFQTYKDTANEEFNEEELSKPSYSKFSTEGNLPVYKQDISNLRLQLNTEPHEHQDRSFGTQAIKICLGNLIDDRSYGENKGEEVSGKEIKDRVMSAINTLTVRGARDVVRRFFYQGSVNNTELSKFLVDQAESSGMSNEVIEGFKLDENNNFKIPLAATSSRNWVESRLISYVGKNVVDLNTKGGSAIQMSQFGFTATGARKQNALTRAFNGGKKLKFMGKDGSIEVMLSTNYFRHVLPDTFKNSEGEIIASYGEIKKHLLDNKIIGPDSKPFGVGYRIPTQGLSSTFSFKAMDVLPDRIGDTIVVPNEFVAMTGSDFDVDKLYLATLNYNEDGTIVQYEKDEEGNELPDSDQSIEALQNRVISSYQLAISDKKNMAETRASIDTLTSMLQDDILPLIKPKTFEQALPMYELLPSFQLSRKEEYTGGKAGIAPFALNSTNHCLTQLVHLNMIYTKGNPYKLGQIDEIRGRDGYRILDWLSAMINAHVDVAKDPYIMTLNVNQITYNTTNLLLRGGMGKTTFYFLAQPILKRFASRMIANRGIYGVTGARENEEVAKLYNVYATEMRKRIDELPDNDISKSVWIAKYNGIADEIGATLIDNGDLMVPIDRDLAFDDDSLIKSLEDTKSIGHLYQQLMSLKAYKELETDAKRLSELVHRSQIDTKKYGNTLAQQMNFRNSYETFISDNADSFIINGIPFNEANPQYALREYFGKTFLSTKLHHATALPRKILKYQTLTATSAYQNIFTSVMGIFGTPKTVTYKNGVEAAGYKHVGDKKFVNRFSGYIDSILRARLSRGLDALNVSSEELVEMLYGSNTMCKRLTAVKNYIRENKDQLPTLINQDGTIKNELLNYLQEYPGNGTDQIVDRIILSESSMNNDFDVENQLVSAFAELLESSDENIREFASDLVKYAYITSYDERGVNSFFNLVPNEWKLENGYVGVIKDGLESFRTNADNNALTLISEENDNPNAMYFPSVNINIARNMWWDDEIVQPFEKVNEDKGDKALHRVPYTRNNKSLLMVDLFSTSRTKGKEFIKMTSGSGSAATTELYRLVGESHYLNEEGEVIEKGKKYIYQRIPKLGITDNGFRVMEFQKTSLEASAFEQNAFDGRSLLNEEQIESSALRALRTPKDKSVTKEFVFSNQESFRYRLLADAKEISGVEDGNPIVDNVMDIGDDTIQDADEMVTPEMMEEADEFVYGTINEEFDVSDAMMDVFQEVDNIAELAEIFAQQSETASQEFAETQNIEESVDTASLTELGKKRKEECE